MSEIVFSLKCLTTLKSCTDTFSVLWVRSCFLTGLHWQKQSCCPGGGCAVLRLLYASKKQSLEARRRDGVKLILVSDQISVGISWSQGISIDIKSFKYWSIINWAYSLWIIIHKPEEVCGSLCVCIGHCALSSFVWTVKGWSGTAVSVRSTRHKPHTWPALGCWNGRIETSVFVFASAGVTWAERRSAHRRKYANKH